MVKEFLGNIKGEKGEKGDTGGFNGESVGAQNLITLSEYGYHNANTTDKLTPDLEKGVMDFDGLNWYFTNTIEMDGKKHSFKVKDYKTNPDYNNGLLQLLILETVNGELGGTQVLALNCMPNTLYEIDLTGREKQNYRIEFRVTNASRFTGYVEKPMLVEADYPVDWQPSYKDLYALMKKYSENDVQYFNAQLRGVVSTGAYNQFNTITLQGVSNDSTMNQGNDTVTIAETGTYTFIFQVNLTPVSTIALDINILVNNVIGDNVYKPRYLPSAFEGTRVLNLKKGDTVKFQVAGFDQEGTDSVSFGSVSRNKVTIIKN